MMKLKWPFLNVFLIFFVLGQLNAQPTLSLQDCIHTGLDRNLSLQVVRNQQTISSNNVTLGNAGYLPGLSLRGQQSGTLNNTDQHYTDGSTISRTGVHNTLSNASISLGWTLFDGFRVQTTYERLETLRGMGELSTRMSVENLVSRIAAEYYNFIQQQRLLDNLKYAVDLSRERVRIDEERYLIGSGSKLQLLQAQVFLNADSSRLSRQHEVVRASRIRLNELMALEDLNNPLQAADTIIPLKSLLILNNLKEEALRSNTSLLIASQNQTISELDRRLIASSAYPFVTFNSGYGVNYNTFGAGTLTRQQTLGMNYGVTVGITIFDGLNQRRRMNNATIEIENRQLIYQEVENGVMADLYTIYNAYLNNLRLLEMEAQNLNVANETLEIAIERYRLGALSGLELREAQKSLLEAEERLLSIQYQAKLAEISLLQIAGRVMEYL